MRNSDVTQNTQIVSDPAFRPFKLLVTVLFFDYNAEPRSETLQLRVVNGRCTRKLSDCRNGRVVRFLYSMANVPRLTWPI